MKNLLLIFAVLVLGACSTNEQASALTSTSTQTVSLDSALLVFEVVHIPSAGIAESVSGKVQVLHQSTEWLPIVNGSTLSNGSRVHIGVGAALGVRFSPTERIEFLSAPKERWVILDVAASR
jgi:hypothetical protein